MRHMLKGEEAAKTQAKAELSSSTFPSITGGAGCAGEDIMHVRAIALKIGAALNTAMPVATQYLASHLLPFRVGMWSRSSLGAKALHGIRFKMTFAGAPGNHTIVYCT
jgi:hypothetical protein